MTDRQRPYSPDEPIIGAEYPGAAVDDLDDTYDDEFAYDDEVADGEVGTVEWDDATYDEDAYEDPFDDYYYDDYYDTEPARQPLFYVFIGLAVILGGLLIFLLFQLLDGGDNGAISADPSFNIRIDQPLDNERVSVNTDISTRVTANSTEQISLIELLVDGEVVDQQTFNEQPATGVYSAILEFRLEETGNYSLTARATSESGASRESDPVTVIAVERIDDRPSRVTGEIISTVNARRGPGDDFEAVETLNPGDVVTIVGRTEDDSWLLLENGTWIRRQAVNLSDSLDLVDVATATPDAEPETPTPEPSPSPTPATNLPDLSPTNASFGGNGSTLIVTIANLGSTPYEGPLVVRVSGVGPAVLEQVFSVSIPGNGSTGVEFAIANPPTTAVTAIVAVDPDGAIEELSEDNNAIQFSLAAPVAEPEIFITGADVSGPFVNVTIANNGGDLGTSPITVAVLLDSGQNSNTVTESLPSGGSLQISVDRPAGSGIATVIVSVGGQELASTTIEIPPAVQPTEPPVDATTEAEATE